MKKIVSEPIISVIIPCRNEEKYIGECLISLLNQENVKDKIEILVVDGMSTDNTRNIVHNISMDNPQVILVDNPQFLTPHALNSGIKNAKGKFIAILGAHADYSSDYLATCLELAKQHPEVSCVGGPIISKGRTPFAKAAALAMSSIIGVGNAKHRFPDYEGYAEMACFPVFRRDVFDKYGLYDESLIRNQDDEFCFRITKSGGKVFISPKAKSSYFVRESPLALFKQYYNYGFWRVAVLMKHKIPISYRQQIPILFYLTVIILVILGLVLNDLILGMLLPALYLAAIIVCSIPIFINNQLNAAVWFPVAVIVLHLSYAAGFFIGIIKFIIIDKLFK
ncbi:MAG: glycosyltransferase family 2 protein [Sphingobacteriaceae bacterium]|nr:glycosyltransferase family 2 protein [Sphingobacteriaceae bacterium]